MAVVGVALIGGGSYVAASTARSNDQLANHAAPTVTSTFGSDPAELSSTTGHVPVQTWPADRATSTPQIQALGPDRVVIPTLGINARTVDVGVGADGALKIPDPKLVGHWDGSAKFTATDGAIVLAGHVDDALQRPGALASIARARPGQLIWVTGHDAVPRRFVVVSLREYHKEGLPASVFSQQGPLRISLITCGGPIIRTGSAAGHYRDNVVVTAVPSAS